MSTILTILLRHEHSGHTATWLQLADSRYHIRNAKGPHQVVTRIRKAPKERCGKYSALSLFAL